jgi:NitT/TauT family transport system permease protein
MAEDIANDESVAVVTDRGRQRPKPRPDGLRRRTLVWLFRVALLVIVLAAWQWLPTVSWLSTRYNIFDRFFVSSPSEIGSSLWNLMFGESNTPIWSYTWHTMSASIVGLVIGMVLGGLFGLALGSSPLASEIFRPFIVALNATPRIAFIPIVVLLWGASLTGSVVVSLMITFFVAFFNAYEGARTVSPPLIQNATVLGASKYSIMWHIRLPYVLAWTLASLPLAATFSVVTVVTGEVLIGSPGLGRLLVTATSTANATLTFVLVVVLAVLGFALVTVAELLTRRLLHWWGK